MITIATIESTDFVEPVNSRKCIFILFCKTGAGKKITIEETGSKRKLLNKYSIPEGFNKWNKSTFAGQIILIKGTRLGRNKLKAFVKSSNRTNTFSKRSSSYFQNPELLPN